jgi:hypothetical protein
VYALNLILATADGLRALRYPDVHELWILERGAGGSRGARHLDAAGSVRVRSAGLATQPSMIVASEPNRTRRADGASADPGRPRAARRRCPGTAARGSPTLSTEGPWPCTATSATRTRS